MGGGFEDNIQFVNGAGIQTVFYGAGINAGKQWRTRKQVIDASATGGLVQYPQLTALNQKTYDLGGGVVHNFSRFTSASVRGQYSRFYTNLSIGGTGPGVQTGRLIQAGSRAVNGSFRTQFRRGLTARMDGGIQQVSSSSPGIGAGQFINAGVTVSGQLNRETTLSGTGTYQISELGPVTVNLPVASLSIEHRRRSGLYARLSGGATVGPIPGISLLERLFGGLTTGYAGRWGEVTVDAQRSIGQQFGLDSTGLQEINNVGATLSKNFTRKFTASVGSSYGGFGGVLPGAIFSRQLSYSGDARYQFNRAMIATVRGVLRQQRGVFNVNSTQVNAGFTVGWSQSRRAEPAAP